MGAHLGKKVALACMVVAIGVAGTALYMGRGAILEHIQIHRLSSKDPEVRKAAGSASRRSSPWESSGRRRVRRSPSSRPASKTRSM
jgi:hypothetical protein